MSSSSDANIDTNIDNYSIDDILTIFNLYDPTLFQIKDVANNLIARMRSEGKLEMAIFFEKAKQKLLEASTEDDESDNENDNDNDNDNDNEEEQNWWEQECPMESQNTKLPNKKMQTKTTITKTTTNETSSKSLIEYEKQIILEKLQNTELELREMKKENQKLRRQLKMLTDR
jgi:hypothetical protein